MSDAVERCPTCRSTVWYPTDQLGRVVPWCDGCKGPPKMAAPEPLAIGKPVWRPIRRKPTKDERALMKAHSKQCRTIAELAKVTGMDARLLYDWRATGVRITLANQDDSRTKWQPILDAGAPWRSLHAVAVALGLTDTTARRHYLAGRIVTTFQSASEAYKEKHGKRWKGRKKWNG